MADEDIIVDEETELPDLGSLSDEEILNLDESLFAPPEQNKTEDENEVDENKQSLEEEEHKEVVSEQEEDKAETKEDDRESEESSNEKEEESEEEEEDSEKKEDEEKEDIFDYKAAYERLTGKFKADGQDFQVKDVDEAIALMQQGVAFTAKSQRNAKDLKLAKVLKNNGIDQEKLNMLVDIHNKNPKAIAQLVKDTGIDTLDISDENSEQYQPTDHSVTDSEMSMANVLDIVRKSDHYDTMTNFVTNELDDRSRDELAGNAQGIKQLHDQMELGVFDIIQTEVQRRNLFGTLAGLSGLEAYRKVGSELLEQKAFDHLLNPSNTNKGNSDRESESPLRVVPNKTDRDSKTTKRKAASGTKNSVTAAKTNLSKVNPLELSDEEFDKKYGNLIP